MRSVPAMLTWELWARGKWTLLLGFFGANLLPVLLYSALRRDGAIDSDDPAFLIMHVVMVQMMMFTIGAAVMTAQGQVSRLFTYPVTSGTIAVWHMLPAMIVTAAQVLVSTLMLNALYDLHWPVWGPVCLMAVAIAAVQAGVWLTESTGWVIVAMTVVAAAVGLWFKGHYGPVFSMPTHWWLTVTPLDVAVMVAGVITAYLVAVRGISLRRRGEKLPTLGLAKWIESVLDIPMSSGRPFRSPAEAQYWFEWMKKGWVMPGMTAFGMLCGIVCWALFSRDASELLEGFLIGGGLLSIVGLLGGLVLGNFGPDDARFEMGSFLATRPLTDAEFSRILLRVTAQSALLSWVIWAAVFAIVAAIVHACGAAWPHGWVRIPWWYWPATLLGPWLVAGVFGSICLTGRGVPLALIFGTFAAAALMWTTTAEWVFDYATARFLTAGMLYTISGLLVLAFVVALRFAHLRGLLRSPVALTATVAWVAMSCAVIFAHTIQQETPLVLTAVLIAAAALAVAPVATAPLALAYNRHR